jgi:hypothetical protein
MFWCAMERKVPLIAVQPGHGIAGTIESRKFDLVDGMWRMVTTSVEVAVRTASPEGVRGSAMSTIWGDREIVGIPKWCRSHCNC